MAPSEFDPNKALAVIRDLEERMSLGRNHRDVDRFRKLVSSLDQWLSKGGYPPAAWDPFSKTPGS